MHPLGALVVDGVARVDPTHYVFATVLRSHMYSFNHPWNDLFTDQYNDELLGDVLEAILGVAFDRRVGKPVNLAMDMDELEEYAKVIEEAVLLGGRGLDHCSAIGILDEQRRVGTLVALNETSQCDECHGRTPDKLC